MQVEQFVMAYQADQDRLRAMLPACFSSLRPVLRINAEIRNEKVGYLEFNTPVEKEGFRGWLNIAAWENVPFERVGNTVSFCTPFLEISFTGAGVRGGCPAEKDNEGCWFAEKLRPPETIVADKEYCDCRFVWKYQPGDASGASTGKTLPAYSSPPRITYEKQALTPQNGAAIACQQVLGCYKVRFERGYSMESYTLEPVLPEEVARCGEILDAGRQFQREQGFLQWTDSYPNEEDIAEDGKRGRGYTLKVSGEIAGYMCIDFAGEPVYEKIDGAWRREGPYAAVHRIALSPEFRGKGLAEVTFRLIGELCVVRDVYIIRVDTHFPNTRMQHVLERSGFVKCGIVTYSTCGERLAYEKLL